jgi:hypothetical protein
VENLIKNNGDALIKYLDCDTNQFIDENDGSLYVEDYEDWLHFSETGYQKYCEPITKFIKSISNSILNVKI